MWLTISEAAKQVGKSPKTIYHRIQKGELTAVTSDGVKKVQLVDLLRLFGEGNSKVTRKSEKTRYVENAHEIEQKHIMAVRIAELEAEKRGLEKLVVNITSSLDQALNDKAYFQALIEHKPDRSKEKKGLFGRLIDAVADN